VIDKETTELAETIAKKLQEIKNAEKEKVTFQEEMKRLHEEISYLKERINKLDSLITSTKYEITHKLNEQSVVGQSVLRVVNSGD